MIQNTILASNELPSVRYRIRFPFVRQHLAHIEVLFDTKGLSELVVTMPVWTPGSYLIREYARHIETIQATNNLSSDSLPVQKLNKHSWSIPCSGNDQVRIAYQIYCREQTVRTNWVEEDYGFLTGAATFLTATTHRERSCIVTIEPPSTWPDIACSLSAVLDKESDQSLASPTTHALPSNDQPWNCFHRKARSFDELVDSPMLFGNLSIRSFEVNGHTHYLACYGTEGTWNIDRAVQDCSSIVAAEHRFWKTIPYQSYWFINIAAEGYGGLEHDDNTVLITSRWAMKKRESYVEWLGLVSHEFFHTWNVRRLRPKTLMQYDYANEQYFPELWIAEGITSYFDDLLVYRAGLTTEQEYLGQLSKAINSVEDAPGKHLQSLHDASFDTWIKHYRPDENTPNSRVSYYVHGSIVAFLLDIKLRSVTHDRAGLDHVMQTLWNDYVSTGYTLNDFEKIASHLAGTSLEDWFQQHVYLTGPVRYEDAFQYLGLSRQPVAPSPPTSSTIFGTTFESTANADADLGMETSNRDGRIVVTKVLRTGKASQAGIMVDDELIAIDGFRLPKDNWKDRLLGVPAEQPVLFTISRRSRIRSITVFVGQKRSMMLSIQSQASPEQIQRRRKWMAGEFD